MGNTQTRVVEKPVYLEKKVYLPAPVQPAPPEFKEPWRKFDWGQKEMLAKRLKEFSVSHSEVEKIRILVSGQIGAGKSSFINSINNVFQERITSAALVDSSTGFSRSFTQRLKSHSIKTANGILPFVFSDIMGLEPETLAGSQPDDIVNAIFGHVKDGYKFDQENPLSWESPQYKKEPSISELAFCLVYVVAADTIAFTDDHHFNEKLKIIRKRISDKRIPQVLVMTKVDEACPLVKKDLRKIYHSKKIKKKMEKCRDMVGVPLNNIFPVKNYHDEIDTDDDVDVLILKALDQIVHLANDRLMEDI